MKTDRTAILTAVITGVFGVISSTTAVVVQHFLQQRTRQEILEMTPGLRAAQEPTFLERVMTALSEGVLTPTDIAIVLGVAIAFSTLGILVLRWIRRRIAYKLSSTE